jgi:hypothetical protein
MSVAGMHSPVPLLVMSSRIYHYAQQGKIRKVHR